MSRSKSEMKYYGLHACEALFQNRAADIIRVYVTSERMKECGPLLKWCAKNKKAYHVVTDVEMEKVAMSVHHEGVTILAKAPEILDQKGGERFITGFKGPVAIFYFDGVQNPHNIGSVARSAAHFSIPLIVGPKEKLPLPTPSMFRIAQGACEHVRFATLDNPKEFFNCARKEGFKVVATSSHKGTSLFAGKLPEKVIFVLGNEVEGVSKPILMEADASIAIPGSGIVESLNVAVSASLLAGEFWRQHRSLVP
jgi:TrmH RNA methyltransferase